MIKNWIDTYKPTNADDLHQALREIMQEIALAGLYRSGFFEKAAFYGGTALRVFYGLNRFSEDLDFSLLQVNKNFKIQPYLKSVINEFEALGIQVEAKTKIKTNQSTIDSAFLKDTGNWHQLVLKGILPQNYPIAVKPIKIKLEIDTQPPLGFVTENKLLLKPFSCYINCFAEPDLFAGKMHALLFRQWKNRVKGRDWFDLEWYIKRGTPLHLNHFETRAKQSGHWPKNKTIKQKDILDLLNTKIKSTSIKQITEDVQPFVANTDLTTIWSSHYFSDLAKKIKFK
ncbi:MAG: nucleotidyl transferase AbiEii/AbiGii toxin family protein [Sphingobacteriaceae bacterium]|nr:nucleotidyl transferase AbiEii/AbiGii toxin family protein [Sphingobacteriaceae bacterium]